MLRSSVASLALVSAVFLLVGACAESEPHVSTPMSVTVASAQPAPSSTLWEVMPPNATPPRVPVPAEPVRPVCAPPREWAATPIEPTCSDVTLKSGQSWTQQLTLQLSSGATTRIDCPRMHFHGQDTPVCVARKIDGRMRGACCPPSVSDPTDASCVGEATVDEMYVRQRVWDWCDKDKPQARPCEPCVWVSGASR